MVRMAVGSGRTGGSEKHNNDPAEYDDLLQRMGPPRKKEGPTTRSSSRSRRHAGSTVAALHLDHLTQPKQDMAAPDISLRGSKRPSIYNYYGRKMSFTEYCTSYISVMCHFYPKSCGCFILCILWTIMVCLASMIWNPTEEYGHIHHDHSNIKSKYDLSMGDIDHWCLGGGDDRCGCEDPLIPLNRVEYPSWVETFKANRKVLKRYQDPLQSPEVDVAFLGESIVEEMDGRWMGKGSRSRGMMNLESIFQKHFRKKAGASLEGVALGIAGDTAPNVLWRLMHGELPDYFNPKVWWVVLGSNDLGRMECSEEVVVLGILRVVEEILEQRPNAKIVINSIFPMTSIRGGLYPVISDYEDSFGRTMEDGQRYHSETGSHHHHHHRALWLGRTKVDAESSTLAEKLPDANTTPQSEPNAAEREKTLRNEPAPNEQSARNNWLRPAANNPIMEDKEKIKKYELGGRNFVHRSAQPFWTSIKAINRELKKFAERQGPDRVIFFDATSLFTAKEGKQYTLLTDLLTVRGHPTEKGFALWEDAIVDKIHKILDIVPTGEGRPDDVTNDDVKSSMRNDTVANGTTQNSAPDLILDEDLPDDDDLDDAILHQNDDKVWNRGENGLSVDQSDDDNDDDDNDDDRDDGELYVPRSSNREGGGAIR